MKGGKIVTKAKIASSRRKYGSKVPYALSKEIPAMGQVIKRAREYGGVICPISNANKKTIPK